MPPDDLLVGEGTTKVLICSCLPLIGGMVDCGTDWAVEPVILESGDEQAVIISREYYD